MTDRLSAYVAVYVRKLLSDLRERQRLLQTLGEGRPFVVQEVMPVAIFDVSGYSSLTTELFDAFGKMSSEVVSEVIGDYIGKISSVVLDYGGDIIKFLGDAILVTFPAWNPEEPLDQSRRRALACCSHILRDLGEYEVDMNRWTKTFYTAKADAKVNPPVRKPTEKEGAWQSSSLPKSPNSSTSKAFSSMGSVITSQRPTTITLGLHTGLTFGDLTHIVVGSPHTHLDYFIMGACLSELETLLENAAAGELAVSKAAMPVSLEDGKLMERSEGDLDIFLGDGSMWVDSGALPALSGKAFADFYGVENLPICHESDETLPLFINQSLYHRIKKRSDKKGEKWENEYRPLSILFIKFLNNPSAEDLQEAAIVIFGVLVEFHGVFQQFTVDDKGCSILAYFGLPPFSTEKYCLHAVQAASAFLLSVKNRDHFAVSVATGDSLFTQLGNARRREAGLLGVVCNTAARLLKISYKENLVAIDNPTYEAVKLDNNCLDLGFHHVKGRTTALRVWGIEPTMMRARSMAHLHENVIGNRDEFAALENAFWKWKKGAVNKYMLLVEGLSGMGKSSLLAQLYELGDHPDGEALGTFITQLHRDSNEEEAHLPVILEWLIPGRSKMRPEAATGKKLESQLVVVGSVAINMMCYILRMKRIVVLLDDFQVDSRWRVNINWPRLQWIDMSSLEVISSVTKTSNEFRVLNLQEVNDSVIESIHEKTQGSLLQVDTLVSYLKDNPEYLEEDFLNSGRFDGILSKSFEAVIVTQLDKLDGFFQTVLRRASIIGHYFKLRHLVFLLSLGDDGATVPVEDVRMSIRECDKFGFLLIDDPPGASGAFEQVSFRHIKIRNAIYESLAVSLRQQLHLKLAEHYESTIKAEERKLYLPLICYHYWRSGNVEKLVLRDIELGLSLGRDGIRAAATTVLVDVFKFIDEECEPDEVRTFLSRELEAVALARLTFSSALAAPMEITKDFGVRTIEMLDGPFPRTKKEMKQALKRNLLRILKLQIKTRNGRRDAPTLKHDGLDSVRHECLHLALSGIIQCSLYDGVKDKQLLLHAMLLFYIYGLERCASLKTEYFYVLDYSSLLIQRSKIGAKIGRGFERRCRELWDCMNTAQRSMAAPHAVATITYLLDTEHARAVYEELQPYWKVRKAGMELLRTEAAVRFPNILMGRVTESTPDLIPLLTETSVYAPVGSVTLLNLLLYENFLLGTTDSLQRIMEMYDEIFPRVPEACQFMAGAHPSIPRIMAAVLGLDRDPQAGPSAEATMLASYLGKQVLASNNVRTFLVSTLLTIASWVAVKREARQAVAVLELTAAMKEFQRASKKTVYLFFGLAAYRMATVAICHLEGGSRNTGKAVRWFKRTLLDPKYRGKFSDGGGLFFVGALFCSVVGLMSADADERHAFSRRADVCFETMGMPTMQRWARGELR
ncbi:hypothetical protein HDU96_001608 [Phlyctochytrium bullatum]|nr:hypothetical protein HDU96_001608 [Phlyctochytrium bullatum]